MVVLPPAGLAAGLAGFVAQADDPQDDPILVSPLLCAAWSDRGLMLDVSNICG
ncbi:MAG: hypothetical protein KDI13_09040 [Alphaproteobacteria bacterium]|nr:hypothetical protein [Alphaproteobacteria bacterium]